RAATGVLHPRAAPDVHVDPAHEPRQEGARRPAPGTEPREPGDRTVAVVGRTQRPDRADPVPADADRTADEPAPTLTPGARPAEPAPVPPLHETARSHAAAGREIRARIRDGAGHAVDAERHAFQPRRLRRRAAQPRARAHAGRGPRSVAP